MRSGVLPHRGINPGAGGDVLNTTARIEGLCNQLGHRLLVSEGVVEKLGLGTEYVVEHLGAVPLRGKDEAVRLRAVKRAEGAVANLSTWRESWRDRVMGGPSCPVPDV